MGMSKLWSLCWGTKGKIQCQHDAWFYTAWYLVLYSMILGLEERCCLHCNSNKGILQCGKYWRLAYLMTFCLGIWKGKSSAECERKCPGGLVSWRMVCIWNNSAQGKHWFWESKGDSVYTMDSFLTNFTLLFFFFSQVKSNPGCRPGGVTVFYSFSFIFLFFYVRTGKWRLVYWPENS